MKNHISIGLLPLLVVSFLAGCQNGDDGVNHEAVKAAQAPLKSAAQQAGGDWDKLTPDQKKIFMDRARGNESSARMLFGMFSGSRPGGPPKHE